MKTVSVITALIVALALYALIFQRDSLLGLAGVDTQDSAQSAAIASQEGNNGDDVASQDSSPDAASETSAIAVLTMMSQAQEINQSVLLRGRTEAARKVDVRAETSGLVVSEALPKGSEVREGEVLCRIDEGTRQAQLAEARARLPEAQARLPEALARIPEAESRLAEAQARLKEAEINDNAARRLSKDGFASSSRVASTEASLQAALAGVSTAKASLAAAQTGVESARAGIEAAEAGVTAALKEIERLTIKAPFAGVLETDSAELGTLLQPGALCATVIQVSPVKLVGFISEIDVAKISAGALAQGRTTAGQQVSGKVSFISRSSDEQTRTFRVEVQLEGTDESLRDGQTAEIYVAAQGVRAHKLPASALTLNNDGDLGVRIAVGDTAQFRPVTIVQDTPEGVWVTGLEDQVDVIIVGQEFVTDGSKIRATRSGADQ